MGLQRVQIPDLGLGRNDRLDQFQMRPGEAEIFTNLVPTSKSGITMQGPGIATREGCTEHAVSITTLNDVGVGNLVYWKAKGLWLATQVGDIWSFPRAIAAATKRFDGTGNTRHWSIEIAKNSSGTEMMWAVCEGQTPQKWDGAAALTSAWANTPPAGSVCCLWRGRMCIAGVSANPERLFFSDVGNPESPAASYGSNWVDIRSHYDDSEPIVDLCVVGDSLLVFKTTSVWAVYDPASFANRRLGGPGAWNKLCSVELRGRCYYFGPEGLWSTDGQEAPRFESYKMPSFALYGDDVSSPLNRLCVDPQTDTLFVIAHRAVGSSSISGVTSMWECYPPNTKNNPRDEWVFSFWQMRTGTDGYISFVARGEWHSISTNPVLSTRLLADAGDNTRGGKIYRNEGNTDDGAAFTATWESGDLKFVPEEPFERLRRVNIVGSGGPVTFTFKQEDGFNLTQMGVSPIKFSRIRPETRARRHRINISGVAPWSISTLELVIRGGKEH